MLDNLDDHDKINEYVEELKAKSGQTKMYDHEEDMAPVMPQITDKLWLVCCKRGKERELALALLLKYVDVEHSDSPMLISSAVQSEKLQGYIYVEARDEASVLNALAGLNLAYSKRPVLVPHEQMQNTLSIDKAKLADLRQGQFIRVRRGLYKGDLGMVCFIEEHRTSIEVKLVPRLDAFEDYNQDDDDDNKWKKKPHNKPEQRFFNEHEIDSSAITYRHDDKLNKNMVYYRNKNMKFYNGFIYKTFNVKALNLDNINPT